MKYLTTHTHTLGLDNIYIKRSLFLIYLSFSFLEMHLESGLYQGRNSIDIESEERDIEMFKQFDMNYVPPKQKMKCNINMNEILVNPKKSTVTHAMTDEFEKRQTSSTNSNSPSSLASSSMDELYEKTPSYYATHHNLTDEKSSAASSLFSSSNGM
jgi:hypothetical protein